MKYTSKQYAQSLYSLIENKEKNEQDVIIRKFLLLLQKRGEFAKRNSIAKEVEKIYMREAGITKVEVETASEIKNIKNQIEEALGGKIEMLDKVNSDILGGIKILINEETLIDASARTMVNKLFAN